MNSNFVINVYRSWDPKFGYGYMTSEGCQKNVRILELEWKFMPMPV